MNLDQHPEYVQATKAIVRLAIEQEELRRQISVLKAIYTTKAAEVADLLQVLQQKEQVIRELRSKQL